MNLAGDDDGNSANYYRAPQNQYFFYTDVGAYEVTTSPFGAWDMAGNILEWVDGLRLEGTPVSRILRGGGSALRCERYAFFISDLLGSSREDLYVGFRIATLAGPIAVPEPGGAVLLVVGWAVLAARLRRQQTKHPHHPYPPFPKNGVRLHFWGMGKTGGMG